MDDFNYGYVRNSKLDKTFTEFKVRSAFKSFGPHKAMGPDAIAPIVLQHFGPKAIAMVTKIMQASYSTGYIPLDWREARVVFIPKPKKEDYSLPGSFRPIALMQFVFKAMERILEWHLQEHETKIGKVSTMQHAYSGRRGTDTALSHLVDKVESAILRGQYALVVSMDIKGAFDNLKTESIEEAMVRNEYPELFRNWYSNFLRKRLVWAEVLGEKVLIQPTCGAPQGGCLSPRAWNITFDPLLQQLKDSGPCDPMAFADDIDLTFIGIDPNSLVRIAQP